MVKRMWIREKEKWMTPELLSLVDKYEGITEEEYEKLSRQGKDEIQRLNCGRRSEPGKGEMVDIYSMMFIGGAGAQVQITGNRGEDFAESVFDITVKVKDGPTTERVIEALRHLAVYLEDDTVHGTVYAYTHKHRGRQFEKP
jgi:hypothetical protein